MARIRPGRAVRKINSQAWSRYSVSKPRKNYIKALPHTSLLVFNMGVRKDDYDIVMRLVSEQNVQIRSNSIEAARQASNKFLEKEIPRAYSYKIVPYPHSVIREKKFATGAGADRISQGMTLSFGRPSSVAARVFAGDSVFEIRTYAANRKVAQIAMRRAALKLSGTYKVKVDELKAQAAPAAKATAVATA
ncbi:MAG: 50S ribosomal protein L16 [Candidatus Micrarchaeota archaeon]|nr:50S ribosomal protein L16 [Candidatus Micrarchaeota archaeon]